MSIPSRQQLKNLFTPGTTYVHISVNPASAASPQDLANAALSLIQSPKVPHIVPEPTPKQVAALEKPMNFRPYTAEEEAQGRESAEAQWDAAMANFTHPDLIK